MKTSHLLDYFCRHDGETIAVFGGARLVKTLDGKLELRGGMDADRIEAKQWCSLFLHEAVFVSTSPRIHPTAHRPVVRGLSSSPWPVECGATPLGRSAASPHLQPKRA